MSVIKIAELKLYAACDNHRMEMKFVIDSFIVALCFVFCLPAMSADQYKIIGLYFFGTDGMDLPAIRAAMPVHVGQQFVQADQVTVESRIMEALKKVVGSDITDVAVINCGHNEWNIYTGLPGKSIVNAMHNPVPNGAVRLPADAVELIAERSRLLIKILAEKGGTPEDDSHGYALSEDATMRANELKIRTWGLKNIKILYDALSSANECDRANAATILGYAGPSDAQIAALITASRDEDSTVRNNATRALGCIANSKTTYADSIPFEPFLQMLNSGIWIDRNKGMFVVSRLSQKNSKVIDAARKHCFQALYDMSLWDTPHAIGSRLMLGKVARIPKDEMSKYMDTENADAIVAAALKNHRNRKDVKAY